MSTFEPGDKLMCVYGRCSEPVEFVQYSDIPIGGFRFVGSSPTDRTFPGPEPAALIRQGNDQQLIVAVANLYRSEDDPNKAAK